MKHSLAIALACLMLPMAAAAQKVAIKTNLLYDATATVNLGTEFALAKKLTFDLSGNLNLWNFGDARWRHYLVQPELRLWTCSKFNGHFFGLHGHTAWYNVGGLPFNDNIENNRYEGFLWGMGLSYGYQWIIGNRWNLEATIGGGFAILDQKKIPLAECPDVSEKYRKTYWGITKVGLSLIYFFK